MPHLFYTMEAESGHDIERAAVQSIKSDEAKEKASVHEIGSSSSDDEYLVGFDGDDDPQNPLNWSRKRKWAMVMMLSTATFVAYSYVEPSNLDITNACS
jgi:hypothetical protein